MLGLVIDPNKKAPSTSYAYRAKELNQLHHSVFFYRRKALSLAAVITGVGEEMNAFKAFKASVPIAWSPNLYITLVRGIPGTRRLHRRTLEALRLRKCNRTVMRWNTPTVRGMLQQVKRLVVIETEEMYKARKQNLENHRALRPPLVINHLPASASGSS
ncbi:50S ribosomal protein L30 [Prunus yedoensis var. nudiflora]|uniref:Large ribosomal subunit protein uL30m n=4 Tax=Prunus TaxID=3754 RepID=A0A314UM96_PRUYE|nr:50S ribosomal protein L30 [Prunus yedoensis var. nudiflora]